MSLFRRPAPLPVAWSTRMITNLDGRIPPGLAADLRAGMLAHHVAWEFTGHLWHDQESDLFLEEVLVRRVPHGIRSAATLGDLVSVVNDEFGWG